MTTNDYQGEIAAMEEQWRAFSDIEASIEELIAKIPSDPTPLEIWNMENGIKDYANIGTLLANSYENMKNKGMINLPEQNRVKKLSESIQLMKQKSIEFSSRLRAIYKDECVPKKYLNTILTEIERIAFLEKERQNGRRHEENPIITNHQNPLNLQDLFGQFCAYIKNTPSTSNTATPVSIPFGSGSSSTIMPPVDPNKTYHRRNLDNVVKFDGKARNFSEFIKSFNTFVGTTPISEDEKLVLLRNKLDEKTCHLIRGIEDYPRAYHTLADHYNNPSMVKRDIIQDIINLPDVNNFRNIDTMVENLGIIRSRFYQLSRDPEQKTFLENEFFDLIWSKFPKEVAEKSFDLDGRNERIYKFIQDAETYVRIWRKTLIKKESNIVLHPATKSKVNLHLTSVEEKNKSRSNQKNETSNTENRYQKNWRNQNSNQPRNNQNNSNQNANRRTGSNFGQSRCSFCQGPHPSFVCVLPKADKKKAIIEKGACLKCFKQNHQTQDCFAKIICQICQGQHSYLICEKPPASNQQQPIPSTSGNPGSSNAGPSSNVIRPNHDPSNTNLTRLKTPGLTRLNILLNKKPFEALFDSGSTHCFINEEQRKSLGLEWVQQGKLPVGQASSTCLALGIVKIKMQIGVMVRNHLFYVIPTKHNVIIGVDAMEKYRIYRDLDGNIIQKINSRSYRLDIRRNPEIELKINIIEVINEDDEEELQMLISKHEATFAKEKGDVGQIKGEFCFLNLENNIPINLKPYRTSVKDQERIDSQIHGLFEKGLIQKSTSDYSFPVVLVNKKDEGEKTRLCIDYRKLNAITIPERYPMPNIGDIENKLLDAAVFSTLDISSGFHHIPVGIEDKRKTAFVTMHEHYEWNVMPFGLKNAPAIFQRIIYNVLKKNELTSFTHNYIDDIIVFSKNKHDHMQHLDRVLEVMKLENIKLKMSKCHFLKEKVVYLGHEISKNTICPLNSNVEAILEYPAPTDKKTLRRFLGKINFYHRFIPDRTKVLDPFYHLLKKREQFNWNQTHQEAFESIKKIITSKLALKIFDPQATTILITDASDVGIGAILKQVKNDQEETIGYFSRKLLPYQKNYVVTEKELLAIIESIEYWHHYLYGRRFTIKTDHKPLKYLNSHKKTHTRIMNWAMRLNQYDFNIEYIKGEDNVEADFLSRNPNFSSENQPNEDPININMMETNYDPETYYFSRNPDFEINVLALEKLEELHQPLLNKLPRGCIKYNQHVVRIKNGKLRYYLPKEQAIEEIHRIHVEKGHIGMIKTNMHFSTKYCATNQNQLVTNVVNGCDICKRAKKQIVKLGGIDLLGPAENPFQIIYVDTKGGFAEQTIKARYLHLAIDAFSRFVWGRTSDSQMAKDYIKLLELIEQDGTPKMMVTDRYGALTSEQFKENLKEKNIQLIHTPTAHPQSNGLIERVGQTLVEKIRCKKILEPSRSWSALAKDVIETYNTTIHCITTYTPLFLLNGSDPEQFYTNVNLVEARKLALSNSLASHKTSKKRIVQKHRHIHLQQGDLVYADLADKLNKKRLDPVFQGPFKIINKLSELIYEIQLPNRVERVHIGKLKPYHSPVIESKSSSSS